MIFSIILLFIFMGLSIYCARKIVEQLYFDFEAQVLDVKKAFGRLEKKKKSLFAEKMDFENQALEIFTLYEITRKITKSLSEEEAFEIFEEQLKEHVNFKECTFLDPLSKEVKDLKKDKDNFIFPLKSKKRRIGTLVVKGVSEEDKEKIAILGHQFALALRRVGLYERIERIAITDSLTEVHTRRYALERFQEEIKRSAVRKIKLSFLMIDVDFFKKFNDTHGHLTGDQILREIGFLIKENIREIDVAGRYGGEEFCVILPDTDAKGASYAAERIRQAADKAVIKAYDAEVKTTLSVGVATFPEHGKKVEELIDKADWALYRAKKCGRNRVCSFGIYDV